MSDGGVLGNTAFGKALVDQLLQIQEPGTLPNSEKKSPFVFVGDEAFARTENFMKPYGQTGSTRWRSWLRHCVTNLKVAGSIPNGVTGIFH
jgi:hypothetical protein